MPIGFAVARDSETDRWSIITDYDGLAPTELIGSLSDQELIDLHDQIEKALSGDGPSWR